jgi:hypothetical protein
MGWFHLSPSRQLRVIVLVALATIMSLICLSHNCIMTGSFSIKLTGVHMLVVSIHRPYVDYGLTSIGQQLLSCLVSENVLLR